jgi:hypothetical protein
MVSTHDMNQVEMESQDREDPPIHAHLGCNIRIGEHTLDISCVNLNDQIVNAYKVHFQIMQRTIESIKLKLQL